MIKQDGRGLMYFGNNKGLLQFDGRDWITIRLPNQTIVRSFAFAPDGKYYLGGQDEMGFLQADDRGLWQFHSLNELVPPELANYEDIWKIYLQNASVIFCSEEALFRLEGDKINVISPKSRFENFFQPGNQIYVQDKSDGLFLLQNDKLLSVPDGDIFSSRRIVSILPHKESEFLILTASNGVFIMNDDGIEPWQTSSSDFLEKYQPYCAIKLSDGGYAIGTSLNGLLLMDEEGKPTLHLNKEKGLRNSTVLSMCEDIQKNLWLGLDNGISYVEINSPFSTIGSELGVEGTGYSSIIHDGKLYLGNNQGLIYTDWSSTNDPMQIQKMKPVENAIGQVWNMSSIGPDVIIGRHLGASYLVGDKAVSFSNIPGAWKFMQLDLHPEYVLEGTYTGLFLYQKGSKDQQDRRNLEFVRKLEGFEESARVMEQDRDGNIWVSHAYKGLYKMKLSDDLQSIEKITFYNSNHGLPTDLFINVATIRDELVFTTPKGIYRYDKELDRFSEHEAFNEIFSDHQIFHRLIEDELGNIWFSADSDFGVLKVDDSGIFNKFELVYFNQFEDMLVDGFEHVYAFDKENVFIGTVSGFLHYNPSHNTDIDFPFETLIRKVTLISDEDSIIYWGNSNIEIAKTQRSYPYKLNDFRFTFSATYFHQIDQLQYRYKLIGFNDNWSEWTSKTEKEYTNLDNEDYTFVVQARNAYRQESEVESFTFSIRPAWYLSFFAKLCYVLFAFIALYGLVQFVRRRESKKREHLQNEQAKTIARKDAEFQREAEKSAAEIIQLRNDKLTGDINHKNNQLAAATMHLVQKSEVLVKIKTELKNLLKDASELNRRKIEQISRSIEADIQLDDNWEQFELYFDQVHENFFKRLREQFPGLTPKDQKLCAYLRMNLTTKEIAPLLNISVRGVEIGRYRLRKKLQLEPDVNLVAFVMGI